MSARPYGKCRVEELETMVSQNRADQGLLADVQAELKRRTTPKARKLLDELDQHTATTGTTTSANNTNRRRRTPPPPKRPFRNVPNPIPTPVPLGMDARYELLRLTFTLEAEILARWGMTDAMPREFQSIVFKLWAAALADGADSFRRSPARLDEDLKTLELERKVTDGMTRGKATR